MIPKEKIFSAKQADLPSILQNVTKFQSGMTMPIY